MASFTQRIKKSATPAIVAIAVTLLSTMPVARAATAQHSSGTVTFKKSTGQVVPKCSATQVLTHVGNSYTCVENSPQMDCTGGAVQKIDSTAGTGTIDSKGVQVTPNAGCAMVNLVTSCPDGQVMQAPGSIASPGSSVCTPVLPADDCQDNEVLTSIADPLNPLIPKMVCLPGTATFKEPADLLKSFHTWCGQHTVMVPYDGDYVGLTVWMYSAWCQSGCSRYCASKQIFGIKLFGSGSVTDFDDATKEVYCTCTR